MLDYLAFDGIFRVSLRWRFADIAASVAIWVPPDGAGNVIPFAVRDLNEKSAGALGSWQGSPEKSISIHFDFERSEKSYSL